MASRRHLHENLCKLAENYLKKGAKVYLEGQLQTRKWQAQDGSDRWSTEVVLQRYRGEIQMLDKAEGRGAPNPDDYGRESGRSSGGQSSGSQDDFVRDMDDEIPF